MKTMLLILATMMVFVMVPAFAYAQTTQASAATPPLSQPLVREGTFAVKLVDVLKLGTTTSETEAESLLSSAGIAPRNGWIADYPITPDIANELREAVSDAETAKTLAVGKSEALEAFDVAMRDYNLAIEADASGQNTNDQSGSAYPDNTVVNNYYDDEGPPVVTYYAPPADYAYLYGWVPYPFWWWSFWFPGFFVLVDFDRIVVVNKTVVVVSNHFFNTITKTFVKVDPVTRTSTTSLARTNTVIGPSVVRNASSTAFAKNWTGSRRTSGSTFSTNRTMTPSRGSTFTAPSSGRSSARQTGNRSFTAPSSGRMAAPAFTHGAFGRPFEGMGGFGGRR